MSDGSKLVADGADAEGYGWFEKVPRHWSVLRLRRAVHVINEKRPIIPGDRYIGLENIEPWTGRLIAGEGGASAEGVGACFREGDVLFGKLRPYLAKAHLAGSDGIGSTELLVLRQGRLLPAFLRYCLLTPGVIDAVMATTYGAKMPRANWEDIGSLFVPLPPIDEQVAVAGLLDQMTTKIDLLIERQGDFLARLNEQRRAIVTKAVTQGIKAEAVMQKTGLPILPAIPLHWAIKRLRHIAGDISVGVVVTPAKYYAETGVPALRSLNVKEMQVSHDDLVFFDEASHRLLAKSKLRADDLVAVRTGKPGTTAVIGPDLDGVNCIDLIIIRQSAKFHSRFLAYVMNSDLAETQYVEGSEGALQLHFNIETAKNLVVPVPPVPEQAEIAAFLDQRLTRLDALCARSTEMIEHLREHRAALISAAVTGQIDLTAARQMAAA